MKRFILTNIAVWTVLFAFAAEVSFKASAPNAVMMGQQFRVTYVATGDVKEFRAPEFKEFDVLMGPSKSTSSSTSMVNGKISSEYSVTYTYILMAKGEGTFTIPEAQALIEGGRYTSNTLTIKVLPEDKSAPAQQGGGGSAGGGEAATAASLSNDNIFIRLSLSKNTVYEQECLLATFKLYTRINVSGFEKIQFPEFEGFLTQEIELPENKQYSMENLDGKVYQTVVIKQTLLFPQRTGELKIPSGKFDAVVRVTTQQNNRSIFDSFFESYTDVKKPLTTNPATVKVLELPSGKPAGFSGAVGDFKVNSSISSNNVKANEAVTIKVDITGSGNVKLLKNPELKFPADFEVYDPKVDVKTQTSASGVTGSKTIEYLVVPRFAGDFTIPSTNFSYFDSNSKSYKTLIIPEYKIHVEKGNGNDSTSQAVINNFTSRETVKHLGQDIRFIKTDNVTLHPRNDFFYGSAGYWFWYVLMILAFGAASFYYRKQIQANANVALTKTKKANKVATKRLKLAQQYLKQNQREAYYEEISKALWGYLSDKLSIPLAYLTKDNVESELLNHQVAEELIKKIMHILDTCEFARYAPSQVAETMDELYGQTADVIGKMEDTIIRIKN